MLTNISGTPARPAWPGRLLLLCLGFLLFTSPSANALQEFNTDVCVYGGTSGGVIAAVQAARMGKTVALIVNNNHLGGMTTSGLGKTDIGNFGTGYIQGVALEFYTRVGQTYGTGAAFTFEPHVAEAVFNEMVALAGVTVCTNQSLASVTLQGQQIVALTMNNGNLFRAKMFIDASYEGDLMAQSGVTYTLGREATSQYGESDNGISKPNTGGHQFGSLDVNPYVITNNPASGLLPFIQAGSPGAPGSADQRIQAYNFRLCLTQSATNRLPITAPPNYDSSQYQLLARYIQAMLAQGTTPTLRTFMNISTLPNNKTDINNNGPVSTDFIGQSDTYPEVDYASRAQIWQAHQNYLQGLLYFLANDSSVPSGVQSQMQSFGLCKDEFSDNGGWPWQLYVREARRMISDYIMTKSNCLGQTLAPNSIGLAAYGIDSHNCQRIVVNGYAENEGDTETTSAAPYPVSYQSIVPKATECPNLLVAWCLSASHIGFDSFRTEPAFMIVGQSAGTAACLAIDDGIAVQQLNVAKLQAQLTADNQLLQWGGGGLIVDDADAAGVAIVGPWTNSTSISGYYGTNYLTDGDTNKGLSSVTFTPTLSQSGSYQVYARWTAYPDRATNVPIDIIYPAGTTTVYVDQTQHGGEWVRLLTTNFNAGTTGAVRIRNGGTTAYVIANAVEFISVTNVPTLNVWATDSQPCRFGPHSGSLTVSRSGNTNVALTVYLNFGGSAVNGSDYQSLAGAITLPAGIAASNISVVPYTNALPVGDKTLTVTLASNSAYAIGGLAVANLTLYDVPLYDWRIRHFGASATNAAIAGDGANPAGDGIPNLVKYALGLDPANIVSGPLIIPMIDKNGCLALSYTRPDPPPPDVNCQVAVSADLLTWSAHSAWAVPEQILLQNGDAFATVVFRDTIPITAAPEEFLTLQVNRR